MNNLIKIISWNVDLQGDLVRWKAISEIIKDIDPDIILIQEATHTFTKQFSEILNGYRFFGNTKTSYFVFMAFKISSIKVHKTKLHKFSNSRMGRNICIANIEWNNKKLCIMTSHLESEKPNTEERKNQFRKLLNEMQESEYSVIFAGDTNLRNKEVVEIGGLPEGIQDFWEFVGKPKDCKITWNVQRKPIELIPMRYAGGRYDRIFFKSIGESKLIPQYLNALGKEEISKGMYASDHLGLSFSFLIE